jgi:glycosyltransferase involved in cell wall biosynthesis
VKPRLVFVSPRYLLPADMGGKIRTAHVLKGLKGGRFHVTLVSPAPRDIPPDQAAELAAMCDTFVAWPEPVRGPLFGVTRLRHLFSPLPVPVATDRSAAARKVVQKALAGADVLVADFLHSAVLVPSHREMVSVLFTHNVETEIFARHCEIAHGVKRLVWQDQLRKMRAFEAATLKAFDSVVAVSERDRDAFRRDYGVLASVIPTGVDLDYFSFRAVPDDVRAVFAFTASMDSLANIDGVRWFMDKVWPLIVAALPDAEMRVIGRRPDAGLVAEAARRRLNWIFTGTVDDVRPHLEGAAAYVIPLRVGGGTRIKAYEAMAFGLPTVSTSVGIEGLAVEPDRHFLKADTDEAFAAAAVRLAMDAPTRRRLADEARAMVEKNCSARSVGLVFETICAAAMETKGLSASPARIPAHGTSAA